MSVKNTPSQDPFQNYDLSQVKGKEIFNEPAAPAAGELSTLGGEKRQVVLGGDSNSKIDSVSKQLPSETSNVTGDLKERYSEITHVKPTDQQREIITHYEDILNTFGDSFTLQKETKLTKESLMDVIKVAVPLLNNPGTEGVQFTTYVQKDSNASRKEKKFSARKTEGGKLELSRLKSTPFAMGGLGKVHYTTSFSAELGAATEKRAFKVAKTADDFTDRATDRSLREDYAEAAEIDLNQEVALLRYLHSKSDCPDTIHNYFSVTLVTPTPDKPALATGFLSKLYEGDLLSIRERIPEKVERGKDMLSGIAFMHKENIVHKDLKPENFLTQKNKTILIDLGGASRIDGGNLRENFIFEGQFDKGSMTKDFTSPQLLEKAKEKLLAAEEKRLNGEDPSLIEKDEEECRKALKRNDVFALGAVFYEMFAGKLPYKLNEERYPIENSISHQEGEYLIQKEVPEKILALLYEMLDPNIDITMDQAQARYNAVFRDQVYEQGIGLYTGLTGSAPFTDDGELSINDDELRRQGFSEKMISLIHDMLDLNVNITLKESNRRYEEAMGQY